MEIIRNKEDLKRAYNYLKTIEKFEKIDHSETCKEFFKNEKIACKKEIRKFNERTNHFYCDQIKEIRVIQNRGVDGFIELLITNFKDYNSCEIFFMNEIKIPSFNSPFDCTGKPFTSWFKIATLNNHLVIFHCVSYDV